MSGSKSAHDVEIISILSKNWAYIGNISAARLYVKYYHVIIDEADIGDGPYLISSVATLYIARVSKKVDVVASSLDNKLSSNKNLADLDFRII